MAARKVQNARSSTIPKSRMLRGINSSVKKVSNVAKQGKELYDQGKELYGQYQQNGRIALSDRKKSEISDQNLSKATLIPKNGQAETINFMFNPTDLSFARSVKLEKMDGAVTRQGLPKVNFAFVEPYKLTLSGLVFDTYEKGESVLTEIQPILNAVDFTKFVDASKSAKSNTGNTKNQPKQARRPPIYYLAWGKENYMTCMVTSLDYKLTMFLPDGLPVRAIVSMNLEEVDLGPVDQAFSKPQAVDDRRGQNSNQADSGTPQDSKKPSPKSPQDSKKPGPKSPQNSKKPGPKSPQDSKKPGPKSPRDSKKPGPKSPSKKRK